jgi:hypothetical protein
VGCFDVVVFTKAPEIEAGERQCSGPESTAVHGALNAGDCVLHVARSWAYSVGLLGHPFGRTKLAQRGGIMTYTGIPRPVLAATPGVVAFIARRR